MKQFAKVRPEAVLRNLPANKQAAIIEYIETPHIEYVVKRTDTAGVVTTETRMRPPTFMEGAAWIKQQYKLTVSTGALSNWRVAYLRAQDFAQCEAAAQELQDAALAADPSLTEVKLRAMGQSFFNKLAVARRDPKMWAMTQRLALQREQLALESQKLRVLHATRFLELSKDAKAQEIANSTASNAEKIEQLGQLMFGEDWRTT